MSKPALLTDDQKTYILNLKKDNPELTAGEVVGAVWACLISKHERPNATLDDKDCLRILEEETSMTAIIAFNSTINRREPSEFDKPWNLAALDKYPFFFPLVALPAVLDVWKYRQEHDSGLTIREAKWAARLSIVEPDIEKLLGLVSLYTGEEIISEIIKPPFDSTVLDKKLMGLPISKEEALKFLNVSVEEYEKMMNIAKQGGIK